MRTFYQSLLPQHILSHLAGWIAHCKQPWIKNWLIKKFIRHYQVNMASALKEDPNCYIHFNDFFIRALKPEQRPIAEGLNDIISPVDATISQIGHIHENQLIQAKKINYSLPSLLGGSAELASRFQQGKFASFYLSPRDYHRVHMPYAGKLQEMIYVPGRLFSVNLQTTAELPDLFVRNERVISLFTTPIGAMAVILVGAMLVSSINMAWAGTIIPTSRRKIQQWNYFDRPISLIKGQELGHFQLGSSVIILFSSQHIHWLPNPRPGHQVQFGQCIGHIS